MIDLQYYQGQDLYVDGVEEDLLQRLLAGVSEEEIIASDDRFGIFYHLSPERRFLLDWYPFKKDAKLLEVGAGPGALTGLFCERVQEVTAVELSKLRATINHKRNEQQQNLKIVVGNFQDIPLQQGKFDYITLIGVLEYTRSFIHSKADAYQELFAIINNYLAAEGELLIAIENKFGLKYWAGEREDHLGEYFTGIEGYAKDTKVETFGLHELKELLKSNGFGKQKFYYPFPDYKFPVEVYSEDQLPTLDSMLGSSPLLGGERLLLFKEPLAYLQLIKNRQFEFFANSFLCSAARSNKE
ncbi:MAG: class I SAM-dependent methyltransferase [Oligoflexia bacterium]|nr:class I SAM-dependent methyltransferase [Oligoflexia bacterium]